MVVVPAKLLLILFYTEKYPDIDLKLYGHPSDKEEDKEANFTVGRK